MVKVSKVKTTEVQPLPINEYVGRGILLSLFAIPAGMVLWVVLWRFNFIASFVSFAIAWLTIRLYMIGAKTHITKDVAPYVLGVVILGVVLAFLSGMVSDAADFYIKDTAMNQWGAIVTTDFWAYFTDNILHNGDLWSSYVMDIAIAIAFAFLGCSSIIKDLFRPKKSEAVSIVK